MALMKFRTWPRVSRRSLVLVSLVLSIAALGATGAGTDPEADTTVEQAIEQLDKEAVEKAADIAARKAVEETVGKAAEKAMEKTVGKATEKAVKQVVEKAAKEAVKRAEAEAVAQAEQTAIRPEELKGPTKVSFLIFLIDIDAIDDANQNFTANVYVRLRWQDRRLASPGAPVRQIPLDTVWNPRLTLVNLTGLMTTSLPEVVQIEPDGTVTYHQRYTAKFSQALYLYEFPRDKHTFTVQFAAAGYSADQLEFVPGVYPADPSIRGGAIADELSLPDWKILRYEAVTLPYHPIETVRAAGFGFRFEADRHIEYYLWQVVLPLSVVVVMSGAAFWFRREDVGVRIGIATSSVLTLIANRFVLASLLPRLPYMTRMDYLSVGGTLLVFLALFVVVFSAFLGTKQKDKWAQNVDLSSRILFPAAYLMLLGWFLFL